MTAAVLPRETSGQSGIPLADYPDDPTLTDYENDYLFDLLGYRILRGALTPEHLARLNSWTDEATVAAHCTGPGAVGTWLGNVELQSFQAEDGINFQNVIEGGEPFEELIDSPAWIDDLSRYIHTQDNWAHPSLVEAFLTVRGAGGFIGIHSGGHMPMSVMQFRHRTGRFAVGQINLLMALTDIGPGDGGTVVVPGSHKSHMAHPEFLTGDDATSVYKADRPGSAALMGREVHLRAGDVLMFTDAITHGSAVRTNPGERRTIVYRYSPTDIARRFHYVASSEFLARLTPARRRLVESYKLRLAPGQTVEA